MSIEEVGNKVKNMAGGKGLWILGGGFALLFLISLVSQSSDDGTEENVKLTGAYTSYPDVATNADVVISTLQDSLDFQTEELSELMQGNFDATNDYIKEGIETNTAITQISHADIMQGIEDLSTQADRNTSTIVNNIANESTSIRGAISSAKNSVLSQMDRQYSSMQSSIASVNSSIQDTNVNLNSKIKDLKTSVNQLGKKEENARKKGKKEENASFYNPIDAVVKDVANSSKQNNTGGVDVFAPSVYYQ